MRYEYLRDPLFLMCFVLYFVNRWLLKPILPHGFFHDHLNDLICIPFWVPIILWGMRHLGLRPKDEPPQWHEILIPLVLWSAVFELWLPQSGLVGHLAVSDYKDIFYYTLGAFLSSLFWHFRYEKAQTKSDK